MTTPGKIPTGHSDTVHDVQFDFYGRRLATASSDGTIAVFDVDTEGKYQRKYLITGHDSPVHAVAWAHPSFGTILASCAYDGRVFLWKLAEGDREFVRIKDHTLHSASVNSLAWAPHEYGPVLACASSDGRVSVLSFNDDGTWAASLFTAHALGVAAVSWAPANNPTEGYLSRRLASCGCDGLVKIWSWHEESKAYVPDPVHAELVAHSDWVRDVAWAPSLGIGRQYLASAGQDRQAFVWTQDSPDSQWNRVPLKEEGFPDTVWRVSWSTAGNVLAVSVGSGYVSLWKENLDGVFEEVSELS